MAALRAFSFKSGVKFSQVRHGWMPDGYSNPDTLVCPAA